MLSDETRNYQSELARYCRGSAVDVRAGMPPERADVYRSLIQNVFDETLAKAYPIAKASLHEPQWKQLIRDFVVHAQPGSPYLWHMPKAFFEFVTAGDYSARWNLPWLYDLLYFEWLEIEVFMMEDEVLPAVSVSGPLTSAVLVLNPHHQLVDLRYPVYRQSVSDPDMNPGLYHLCIYRHPSTLKVHFSELSSLGAFWLRELQKAPRSGKFLLDRAETEYGVPSTNIATQAESFFNQLIQDQVILGYQER